jgi:hypothetical protein
VRRVVVLAVALAFIAGFAALTVEGIRSTGFGFETVAALVVLVLLAVGIVGALRNPPGG